MYPDGYTLSMRDSVMIEGPNIILDGIDQMSEIQSTGVPLRVFPGARRGTTIRQALVRKYGFTGSYSSVRRYLQGVEVACSPGVNPALPCGRRAVAASESSRISTIQAGCCQQGRYWTLVDSVFYG